MRVRGARVFCPVPCPNCGDLVLLRADIGSFRLMHPLARTGLGQFFRAFDRHWGREAVIKVLQLPMGMLDSDGTRFFSALEAMMRLDHPHCAQIYDGGIESGFAFIAREVLPGGDLAERLQERRRLGLLEVLEVGLQAAEGLRAAWANGLTHRNLTPEKLQFAANGTLKVTGFAAAVIYEIVAAEGGFCFGRNCYTPPERLLNEGEDDRSDIYTLGVILLQALSGTVPYEGEVNGECLLERMENEPLRVETFLPAVPREAASAINRMVCGSQWQRFQNWDEVIQGLSIAQHAVYERFSAVSGALA
jgi:serine/threonine protein kinase